MEKLLEESKLGRLSLLKTSFDDLRKGITEDKK